ncbi:hypothetical protein HPB47_003823 [Ixodes persulcatus]|uniref:Uncharacterized protein n=1 Tax=Ixodes persulcatus TaxID=34615 RepID=A0AC60PHE3_IXOPE|nr:hypothetical protein HPB47_003823 [Ixodes persulcatus]
MMRAYRRGDVILTSEPFAYVVDPKSGAGKVCDYCLKRSGRLKGCAKCRVAHYCNKFCESSALSDHLTECSYFQEMFPCIPNTTVRLMARILIKLQVKELPPNDISRVEALELAFECCAKRGLHAKAAGYAMQILDLLSKEKVDTLLQLVINYLQGHEPSQILDLDVNGLYAATMREALPVSDLEWMTKDEIACLNIDDVPDGAPTRYILEEEETEILLSAGPMKERRVDLLCAGVRYGYRPKGGEEEATHSGKQRHLSLRQRGRHGAPKR